MTKILIVDEEEKIREMIYKYCLHEGYECDLATNGQEALTIYEKQAYDVVIMDVMMPVMDGFETLKRMNAIRETHCIMLTALGSEHDKIYGFKMGCEDYVVKPFSLKELMMRIKVVLKRQNNGETKELKVAGVTIDLDSHRVLIDGKEVYMANKEYELLLYLMENAGKALTREAIIARIWGYEYDNDDRTLDTHMKLLRKDLGVYAAYISTIRGVGYRFEKAL